MCNLQTAGYQWSISGLVPEVNLACLGTLNSGNSAKSHQEFLKAALNDLTVDIRLKGTMHKDRQADFLLTADRRTKRLSFLWLVCNTTSHPDTPVCGCYGGCQFTSSHLDRQAKLQESDVLYAINEEEKAPTAAVCDIINPCNIAKIHNFLFNSPPGCLSHELQQTADSELAPFENGSSASLESFHSALSYVSNSVDDAGFGIIKMTDTAQGTVNQQRNSAHSLTEYSLSMYSFPIAHGAEALGHVSLQTFATGCSTPFPFLQWNRMKKQVPDAEKDRETESHLSIQVELKDSLTIKAVPQAFQILSR